MKDLFITKIQDEKGEVILGIKLSEILHFIYENESLFIMMSKQKTELQPTQIPQLKGEKVISTKTEMRNVTDFLTFKITTKEDIDRFLEYAKSVSI